MDNDAREVIVCSDASNLSRRAGTLFVSMARSALAERGHFTVCLSGGSTPRGLYALLGQEFRDQVSWEQVHIFWGDERVIPLAAPDNHFHMATDLMLGKVPIPTQNIHRMRV